MKTFSLAVIVVFWNESPPRIHARLISFVGDSNMVTANSWSQEFLFYMINANCYIFRSAVIHLQYWWSWRLAAFRQYHHGSNRQWKKPIRLWFIWRKNWCWYDKHVGNLNCYQPILCMRECLTLLVTSSINELKKWHLKIFNGWLNSMVDFFFLSRIPMHPWVQLTFQKNYVVKLCICANKLCKSDPFKFFSYSNFSVI